MPDGFLFGGMIAANAREIDKSGDGSQKGGDNAPNDTIECARVETLHRDEITHHIEHEAEREESDGRMHQKRMKRVAERFSFKQLLDHNHYFSSGTFAPAFTATARHFFFAPRATPMP